MLVAVVGWCSRLDFRDMEVRLYRQRSIDIDLFSRITSNVLYTIHQSLIVAFI